MYFETFPLMNYSNDKITTKQVTDLFRRVKIKEKILDEASLYQEYDVPNGERPEDTAMKHFGDPQYHWVILMTNKGQDGFYDWPLDFRAFETFITDKYANPDATHHYEKAQSSGKTTSNDYSHLIEVNSTEPGAMSVSNRQYEERIQDAKRKIKLLNPGFLSVLLEEFDKLMNE